MPVHAVVLPATVLLVPGAGGVARPLEPLRRAVLDELSQVTGPTGAPPVRWGVLAPAARTAVGRRRPSLAGAGISDRWLGGLDGWPAHDAVGPRTTPAAVPASVAQFVLADAVGPDAAADALVVELAEDGDDALLAATADELGDCDALLVAGGDPGTARASTCTPGVTAVLELLAARGGWTSATRSVVVTAPHLPDRYDVVTWSGRPAPTDQTAAAANQPTPASSSQKRTVRPTRTVGT
ncbi:hypothetical protein MWU57_06330 [Isoptericola sp. S6320L]|uniref:hypothetical protein n=1 Tax=Isoptericola sp. S6320L TaxID=2926411 RepID=UPI001FF3E3FD|nr:hypothetical protein [Isoptericola sp. S6320L]MCK0116644.1 hypothetical protein [Isoptericola sp. S6320L]